MTKEEILTKVLEKANARSVDRVERMCLGNFDFNEFLKNRYYYTFIFSHSFARKFWGKKVRAYYDGKWNLDVGEGQFVSSRTPFVLYEWQHHLQAMVLEPEPLDYLKKFLEDGKDKTTTG